MNLINFIINTHRRHQLLAETYLPQITPRNTQRLGAFRIITNLYNETLNLSYILKDQILFELSQNLTNSKCLKLMSDLKRLITVKVDFMTVYTKR